MAKITTLDGVTHEVGAGDKVTITLDTGDSSTFTVVAGGTGSLEATHNYFSASYIQSLENLEKKSVPIPDKPGAIVGHPAFGGYVTYQLSDNGEWFRVDTSCGGSFTRGSDEEVRKAMGDSTRFVVLYEGRG